MPSRDMDIGIPPVDTVHNDAAWFAEQAKSQGLLTAVDGKLDEANQALRDIRFINAEGVGVEDAEDLGA